MIPSDHPRYHAMVVRHSLIEGMRHGLVAPAGLIAQGRGEAFDYLFGEETPPPTLDVLPVAAALLLLAAHPVIAVNGNSAVLAPKKLISLSEVLGAPLEINLFYEDEGSNRRERIAEHLRTHGAQQVLGVTPDAEIPGLSSARRNVSSEGIARADVVVVSLEDGDRTEKLIALGKKVIAIDLNPLCRTVAFATVPLIDNLTRCLPLLETEITRLRKETSRKEWEALVEGFSRENYEKEIMKVLRTG